MGPMPPACSVALRCCGSPGAYGLRSLFVTAVFNCENKNPGAFATFLRLGTPFRLCKTETGYRAVAHLRFCAADLRLGALKQSPIAKKLQPRPVFCFCAFGMGSRWCGTGARVVGDAWERKQRYGWGGPGVVRGVASFPLSPPFAPKASEWGCFCPKSTVRCCDLWRRCRRTQGGWKKSPTFSHCLQDRYLGVFFSS